LNAGALHARSGLDGALWVDRVSSKLVRLEFNSIAVTAMYYRGMSAWLDFVVTALNDGTILCAMTHLSQQIPQRLFFGVIETR
jgi:hypothetical protein